jgi:hypothetical protein
MRSYSYISLSFAFRYPKPSQRATVTQATLLVRSKGYMRPGVFQHGYATLLFQTQFENTLMYTDLALQALYKAVPSPRWTVTGRPEVLGLQTAASSFQQAIQLSLQK